MLFYCFHVLNASKIGNKIIYQIKSDGKNLFRVLNKADFRSKPATPNPVEDREEIGRIASEYYFRYW